VPMAFSFLSPCQPSAEAAEWVVPGAFPRDQTGGECRCAPGQAPALVQHKREGIIAPTSP